MWPFQKKFNYYKRFLSRKKNARDNLVERRGTGFGSAEHSVFGYEKIIVLTKAEVGQQKQWSV